MANHVSLTQKIVKLKVIIKTKRQRMPNVIAKEKVIKGDTDLLIIVDAS